MDVVREICVNQLCIVMYGDENEATGLEYDFPAVSTIAGKSTLTPFTASGSRIFE